MRIKTSFLVFTLFALSTFAFSKSFLDDEYLENFDEEKFYQSIDFTVEDFTSKEFFTFFFGGFDDINLKDNCAKRFGHQTPDLFMFLPSFVGKFTKESQKIDFSNNCFKQNTLTLTSLKDNQMEFELTSSQPRTKTCSDVYLFHLSDKYHVKIKLLKGKSTIKVKNLTPEQIQEVAVNGLRVFSLCGDLASTAKSAYKTIKFVLSDYPKEKNFYPSINIYSNANRTTLEQEKEHVDFLKKYANITIEQRLGYEDKILDLEPFIQTGDFIGLSQVINGESCFIQYMTGGRISHSAVAVRIDGELFVAESDSSGIALKPYAEFIKYQVETYHSVAWFPLSEKYRKKFNEEKAIEFIKKRVGLPYGMKNFIFAALDTYENLPNFVDTEVLQLAIQLIEKIKPELGLTFIGHAMGMRLGLEKPKIANVVKECVKRGKTFEEVMMIPERDDWNYFDGENWVCSTFVVGIYKEAGIFEGLDIQAHEFTPKDIYMMGIYDKEFKEKRPEICKEADPDLDYCMILGKFRINAKGYNSVPLYDRMNENCPAQAPIYDRPMGC